VTDPSAGSIAPPRLCGQARYTGGHRRYSVEEETAVRSQDQNRLTARTLPLFVMEKQCPPKTPPPPTRTVLWSDAPSRGGPGSCAAGGKLCARNPVSAGSVETISKRAHQGPRACASAAQTIEKSDDYGRRAIQYCRSPRRARAPQYDDVRMHPPSAPPVAQKCERRVLLLSPICRHITTGALSDFAPPRHASSSTHRARGVDPAAARAGSSGS